MTNEEVCQSVVHQRAQLTDYFVDKYFPGEKYHFIDDDRLRGIEVAGYSIAVPNVFSAVLHDIPKEMLITWYESELNNSLEEYYLNDLDLIY